MLKHLQIKNFKSWEALDAKIAPITGFFGTNSSGKSSILQFLLMLKQTVENPDDALVLNLDDDKRYVELGTFEEIIHRREIDRVLEFGFTTSNMFADYKLQCKIDFSEKSMKVVTLEMDMHDIHSDDEHGYIDTLHSIEVKLENSEYHIKLILDDHEEVSLGRVSKFYKISYDYSTRNSFSLQSPAVDAFSQIYYLGPLREYPKRHYPWGGAQRSLIGTRGEFVIEALLGKRGSKESIEHGGKSYTLEAYIAHWLNKLELIHDFKIVEIAKGSRLFEARVRQTKNSPWVSLLDVGFGVSQVLPVLTLCFFAPEGSILLIEQPEIHLHPKVQAGLADVFIDAIEKRGVQIILESHSEHLLKRLQRRMAEETFAPEKAALYFCEMAQRGASTCTSLDLDEFGNIKNWPKNFFGDSMGEIFAASEAMFKRKKAQKNANKRD